MQHAQHCLLCENRIVDYATGARCSLTNQKPDFTTKCPDIYLGEIFEEKLKEVNIAFEMTKKLKSHAYFQSGFYVIVSLSIILAGYLLGSMVMARGVFSTIPLIIMGVGFLGFTTALGPLNSYRSQMSIAKKNKANVDNVVDLYGMKYDIDIQFGREYHGTQETAVKLEFKRDFRPNQQ